MQQVKNMFLVLEFHEIRSTSSKYIWTVFVLKWNLDKDGNILNFEFQVLGNIKHTVEILGYHEKNECPPTILIQTKPFIVSTNLSMRALIHKIVQR